MTGARSRRFVDTVGWLTAGVTAAFVVAQTTLIVAFVLDGDEGISDNWVGYLSAGTLFATLGVSLLALGVAIWAASRGMAHRFRWLMRYEFMVLIVLVALAELFVFE